MKDLENSDKKLNEIRNFEAAPIMQRILAGIIDLAIICLISIISSQFLPPKVMGFEKVFFSYYMITLNFSHWHTTVGGKIFKFFIVKKTGANSSGWNRWLRIIFYFAAMFINVIFYTNYFMNEISLDYFLEILVMTIFVLNLPMFFTKEKRSLIDFLSATKVVKKIS